MIGYGRAVDVSPRAVDRLAVPHYGWGQGCDGWRLLDGDDLSVIEERVPPGAVETWHVHERARQFFYILSGHAQLATTGGVVSLSAGMGAEVPPGVAHRFVNAGHQEVTFLVVSAPSTRGDRKDLDGGTESGS